MEHQPTSSEITFAHHVSDADFKKRVIRTTVWLSAITIVELAIGLLLYAWDGAPGFLVLALKGIVCILTLLKAYMIVSIFMHLGDEIRNMIMTIVVPLMLFIWFIAAFIIDGNSYRNLRNEFDPHFRETTMPKEHHAAPAKPEQPQPGKQ